MACLYILLTRFVSNIVLSVGGLLNDELARGIFKIEAFTVAVLVGKI